MSTMERITHKKTFIENEGIKRPLTCISCAVHTRNEVFYCLQFNIFAVSEVVIHAFSRPRNRHTDQQTGGQSTGQTQLLNPAVRMSAVG